MVRLGLPNIKAETAGFIAANFPPNQREENCDLDHSFLLLSGYSEHSIQLRRSGDDARKPRHERPSSSRAPATSHSRNLGLLCSDYGRWLLGW